MPEPGTAQVLEIPVPFATFHTEELVQHADIALAAPFFEAWKAAGGAIPAADRCAGYRKALYLGGADTVGNLEPSDLEVYRSVMSQVLVKLRPKQNPA